jgi:hypothetical protein
MVEDPNDMDSKTVVLKVRKCDSRDCRRDAVVIDGPGADCPFCRRGEIVYTTGDVKTVEMLPENIEEVADSEIVEIKD